MIKRNEVDYYEIDGEIVKIFNKKGEEIDEVDISALVDSWIDGLKDRRVLS